MGNRFKISSVRAACQSKLSAIRSVRGRLLKELAQQTLLPGEHPKSLEAAYYQEEAEQHVLTLLAYISDIELHGDVVPLFVDLSFTEYKPLQGHFPVNERHLRPTEASDIDLLGRADTEKQSDPELAS